MFAQIYLIIENYQQKYKELVDKQKRANFHNKSFCGGGIVI